MDRQLNECTTYKCYRSGSEDHLIAQFLKLPKDNKRGRNTVRFNERVNHAFQIESENSDNDNNKKDASMA